MLTNHKSESNHPGVNQNDTDEVLEVTKNGIAVLYLFALVY